MKASTDTRNLIIDKAAELLMQRGFNGFSYRDISTQLGVKNAAIHYHFPTKADLALAMVEEYQQSLRDKTAAFMAYGGPATPQLEGLLMFADKQFCTGRCICPCGALAVNFDDLPDKVQDKTRRFMTDSVNWLSRVLETGREQKEFVFAGDAKQKAIGILAMLQGARQMARITGRETLQSVFKQVRGDVGMKD